MDKTLNSTNLSSIFSTNFSHVEPSVNLAETIVSSLQALFIFCASSLCLIAFFKTPALRTPFNYFLISILIAELALSVQEVFLAIQHFHGHWIFSQQTCTFILFIFFSCEGVVGNAHFLIAANRTWALFSPHHFLAHNTKQVTFFLCGSVWVATLSLVLPWIILNEPYLVNGGPVYMCRVRMTSQHPFSSIIMLLFVSPTAFIISSYPFLRKKQLARQKIQNSLTMKTPCAVSAAGVTLGPKTLQPRSILPARPNISLSDQNDEYVQKQHLRRVQMEEERSKQKRKSNTFLVLTSIVLCAVVFWTPIVLYGVGEVLFLNSLMFTDTTYFALTSWLACSTCLDPVIFIATVPLLRKQIKEMLRSLWNLSTRPCVSH